MPDTIRVVRDRRNPMTGITHYSLRPSRYMTLLEFADGLKFLAGKAVLVLTLTRSPDATQTSDR